MRVVAVVVLVVIVNAYNVGNNLEMSGSLQFQLMWSVSAKKLLGRCYRLAETQCGVFTRAMMLFGLHITASDDESVGQHQM